MNTPDDSARTASVHWEGDIARGKGAITTESGTVAGLSADEFQQLAAAAKENCPISRALRAVEIVLEAKLDA